MSDKSIFSEAMKILAKQSWKKLTKAERSARARHAVKARWAKVKKKGKKK